MALLGRMKTLMTTKDIYTSSTNSTSNSSDQSNTHSSSNRAVGDLLIPRGMFPASLVRVRTRSASDASDGDEDINPLLKSSADSPQSSHASLAFSQPAPSVVSTEGEVGEKD